MDHRSPLDNIFNIIGALPQGHDKPVKHALYNAVAILLLCLCCGAAYALYMILEPFIKPLIWALLVGSVLHPIKYRLAQRFRSWFEGLDEKGTPVIVGFFMCPFNVVDNFSEFIGSHLLARIKIIVAVIVTVPLVHVVYNYTPRIMLCMIWKIIYFATKFVTFLIGNITFTVMASILILYVTLMVLFWKPSNNKLFHYSSIAIWLSITCYISNTMGSLQVPVFILLLAIFFGGFILELYTVKEQSGHDVSWFQVIKYGLDGSRPQIESGEDTKQLLDKKSEEETLKSGGDEEDKKRELSDRNFELSSREKESIRSLPISNTGLLITDKGKIHVIHPANATSEIFTSSSVPKVKRSLSQPHFTAPPQFKSLSGLFNLKKRSELRSSLSQYRVIHPDEHASYYYFYALAWACGIMIFWKHIWLLPVLPIPILFFVVKHLGFYLGVWSWLHSQLSKVANYCAKWFDDRYDALVPVPIRGLLKFLGKLDKTIKFNLKDSIDTVASSVVIFGLIIFVLCASIFILLQVYAETIMLVQMTSNVINQTVVHNPELRQLLPPTFDDTVDSILDNAYQYGREGISKAVRGMLSEVDSAKSEKLEKQVLELWDRIYQTWMTVGTTNGPKVTTNAVQTSWNAFMDDIQKSPEIFNINGIVEFAKQNLGMLMSLLESVWAIVKGNISLVLGSFSAFVSVLLGGGTAVLNFFLNMIIFLTTLFYLLSSSGSYYKPVEMMTNVSTNGSRFGLALEDAINGVFTASFKMAVFYGMWTWFIHNLFGMQIVYLPSAFALILGAAPFLGTYWACIPAVLDLWLAQGKGLYAILFFAFQFMPTSIVDTAIYAEIKGGGHPYLTGLAIAGGIFCLGLEGAIVGPLVLCGLYVAMDLSTTLFKESPSEESINIQQLSRLQLEDIS